MTASAHSTDPAASSDASRSPRHKLLLSLAALGIVYGDIGTSPLYSIKESFLPAHGVAPTSENVLGVLSLIVWSLLLVVSFKYLLFILRADNRGEGGILALTSLITPTHALRRGRWGLIVLGLFGTALLYGDGMLTPAVSVLGALEGLEVVTPKLQPYIVPLTCIIIAGLFLVQRQGTARVGRVFGPVMVAWFVTIAALAIPHIVSEPYVFAAILPTHAVRFFADNGWHGFVVLGSVFLVVTGGEALYADMGHFGRAPIRNAWFALVLPSLLLNYFGQGALLIADPSAVVNPFYRMVPAPLLIPVVGLAVTATVIASQALISGAFSLTLQAVQLGYCPRLKIEHTSATERGQIYIPFVNWALMICCIALVIGFRTASNLAAAYGIAVTTTMLITTILFHFVATERWGWSHLKAGALTAIFVTIDLGFWGANLLKIPHGGWFPLVIGAVVFTLLTTWKRGRVVLAKRLEDGATDREAFLANLLEHPPHRARGTAVFLYGSTHGTPPALLHNLKHNGVLHERVVFLSIRTEEIPVVPAAERSTVTDLGHGLWQVVLRFGFMEEADVPAELMALNHPQLQLRPMQTTYFLGRETLIATHNPGMALWREKLFAFLAQNARSAASFFQLPPNRVVELGSQVEL